VACELAAFSERATKRGMTIREFRIQTHAVHEPHPIRHILDLDISPRSEVSFHAVFECDARVFDTHRVQCINFRLPPHWPGAARHLGRHRRPSAARRGRDRRRGGVPHPLASKGCGIDAVTVAQPAVLVSRAGELLRALQCTEQPTRRRKHSQQERRSSNAPAVEHGSTRRKRSARR
jgi:hypothetical protein